MANPEHLEILKQGVGNWNSWIVEKRNNAPLFWPDLSEANLIAADLQGGVNLSGASLSGANLSGADFNAVNPFAANLSGVDLERANLPGANLIAANPFATNLSGASLSGASLSGANLSGANLSGANLSGADLSGADLSGADLSGAALFKTKLFGANLCGANLSESDIRYAKNVILDDTTIKDTHFSNKASDPWSVLRQKYTGPMLLFNLLFLIIFFGFNTVQTFTWTGINSLQAEISKSQQNLPIELEHYILQQSERMGLSQENSVTLAAKIKEKGTNLIQGITPCLEDECADPRPIWQIILNLHDSWWKAILTITLLAYNIFRAGFTYSIGLLRDAEERSSRSPTYASYKWWYKAHCYFMTPVLTVAILSILINGYDILVNTTVILPLQ